LLHMLIVLSPLPESDKSHSSGDCVKIESCFE